MSSLIFSFNESTALVATDTLSVSYPEKAPYMFTTKAFIIPHLKMIMCGTGAGGLCDRWFQTVNHRMIVSCIDHLDYHTPKNLSTLWKDLIKDFSGADITSTIYHFGFSKNYNTIHGYAYRSTSGFKSERLEYGVGIKPECTPVLTEDFFDDIKVMMREQRKIQKKKPKEERVEIGGEIQIHLLTKDGFRVFTIDKFEDFDEQEDAIYNNYDKCFN